MKEFDYIITNKIEEHLDDNSNLEEGKHYQLKLFYKFTKALTIFLDE